MDWERRHKDFLKDMSVGSSLFLFFSTLVDMVGSYWIYSRKPVYFLENEINSQVVSWLSGGLIFPVFQVILNIFPYLWVYFGYKWYMNNESELSLGILASGFVSCIVLGSYHMIGFSTWFVFG